MEIPSQQHPASTKGPETIAEPQLPLTAESSRPQSGTAEEAHNPASSAGVPLVQPQFLLRARCVLHALHLMLAACSGPLAVGWHRHLPASIADLDVLACSMSGTRHGAQTPQPPLPPLFAGGVGLAGSLWDSFVGRFNTAIARVRQKFIDETFDLPRVSSHSDNMFQACHTACCSLNQA